MPANDKPLNKHTERALAFHLDLFWEGAGREWRLTALTALFENSSTRTRTLATVTNLRELDALTRRLWAAGGRPSLSQLFTGFIALWELWPRDTHGYASYAEALAAWESLRADARRQSLPAAYPDYPGYSDACKADKETKAQRARREAETAGY